MHAAHFWVLGPPNRVPVDVLPEPPLPCPLSHTTPMPHPLHSALAGQTQMLPAARYLLPAKLPCFQTRFRGGVRTRRTPEYIFRPGVIALPLSTCFLVRDRGGGVGVWHYCGAPGW